MPEPSPLAQAPAQTFREAYGVLQQHAETLRDQDEPNIDDLLTIVTESVAAYKVCRQRIDAVEAALKAALDDADMGTSFSPEGVKAPLAGPAAREVPQRPAPDPDDVPF